MCGIGGKLFFDRARVVDPALLSQMSAVLRHRGPDDAGVYYDGQIGLAHRRLSIIDLSPAGHQPMSNIDGTVWITYNGEVYNFLDLRKELENDGVTFRSKTDTEVILSLYERHGTDCIRYLRGMFAFAIWDGRSRSLFLARDRLGKKPLYYYHDAEKFVFASEPKGILQDPEIPVSADFQAIHHYLTFGYVPSPQSAFLGFRKLPPAHYLVVRDGKVQVERYWRLRYDLKNRLTEEEQCEQLLANLREAVRIRMISDVPVGAFLSGGIDSSTIVALMSEFSSGPVKTFCMGFEEEEYNEIPYARLVAERYGTDHHEFVVKPDVVAVLPELIWYYNEPYADCSAISTYYLAKMTQQHVGVALNGDGGDENFAGYGRYLDNLSEVWFDRLPWLLRRSLESTAKMLPDLGHSRGLYLRGKRWLAAACQEPRRRYARWISFFLNTWKTELYTPSFREAMGSCDSVGLLLDAYPCGDHADVVDGALAADVAMYLPEDLLVKVDIATMAHSLEARSPMVDHRFMEFAASLPSDRKLKGGTKKYILKQAVRELLPAAVIDRPKQGFGVPIGPWFRKELREMAYDVLLSSRCVGRGLFQRAYLQQILDEHMQGRVSWHPQLWCLLMLELWFQRFIDGGGRSDS